MRKLFVISYKTDIQDFVHLTNEKDRNTRYIATLCTLNKIKTLCQQSKLVDKTAKIMQMYNFVYPVRTKDVYANIRSAMCEYFVEFLLISDLFYQETSNIARFLKDKKDTVRKKAVKACIKLIDYAHATKIKIKKEDDNASDTVQDESISDAKDNKLNMTEKQKKIQSMLQQILTKNKKYILQMAEHDTSMQELLTKISKHYTSYTQQSYKTLTKKELNLVFAKKIQQNSITSVLDEMNTEDCIKKLELTIKHAQKFLSELQDEQKFDTYYELIPKICKNVNKEVFEYIKKYKSNLKYVTKLVESLCYNKDDSKTTNAAEKTAMQCEDTKNTCDVNNDKQQTDVEDVFYTHASDTMQILEYLHDLLYKYSEGDETQETATLIDSILMFYKMYENEYNTKIMYFLENMKRKKNDRLVKHAIKFFDVSDYVLQSNNTKHSFETLILAYFWKVTNSDYFELERFACNIQDLQDFVVACNYLLFTYDNVKKYNVLYEKYEFCYDAISAMKMVYDKIKNEVEKYVEIQKQARKQESDAKLQAKKQASEIGNDSTFSAKQKLEEMKKEMQNKKVQNNDVCNDTNTYEPVFAGNYAKVAHIVDASYEILYHATESEVMNALKNIENMQDACLSFFDYLQTSKCTDTKKIASIAKQMQKTVCRNNTKNSDIAQKIVSTIQNNRNAALYDCCFVYFANVLSVQDCEEILRMTSKKTHKFEKMLAKKIEQQCKMSPVIEQKEVYKF